MAHAQKSFHTHVRAFSELLIVLRRELDNDLDKGVIMAIVAERHYEAMQAKARAGSATAPDGSSVSGSAVGSGGVNAYSLALYSDIPRETVRRKVKDLIAKGWLSADGRGNLTPTDKAARDLRTATEATHKYMSVISKPEPERE